MTKFITPNDDLGDEELNDLCYRYYAECGGLILEKDGTYHASAMGVVECVGEDIATVLRTVDKIVYKNE